MLAMTFFWQGFLALALISVCCLLVLIILVQRGRGGGLAGAFGGGGGSSAFGAKTGDVFTWITVVVASIFLLLNVVSNYVFDQSPDRSGSAAVAAEPVPVPITPQAGGETQTPGITVTPVSLPGASDGQTSQPVELIPLDGPPPGVIVPVLPAETETGAADTAATDSATQERDASPRDSEGSDGGATADGGSDATAPQKDAKEESPKKSEPPEGVQDPPSP